MTYTMVSATISLLLGFLLCVSAVDIRLRLNNGVIFKPIRQIQQTSTFWYATFVVAKPDLKVLDNILDDFINPCKPTSHSSFCENFSQIFDTFNIHTGRSLARIRHYAKEISLLGNLEPGKSHSRRTKRNIFGKLIGSITGLVDESRLKVLAAQIDRLETGKIHDLFLELNSQADKLSSTNVLTNKRIDNLWHGVTSSNQNIQKNMDKIHLLRTYAIDNVHALNETTVRLTQLSDLFFIHIELSDRTNFITELEFAYQDHLNGIHSLIEGFLPIEFISHQKLRDTLHEVRSNLLLSDNAFKITHDDVGFYYRTKGDVLFRQTATNLYIQLKIPISRSNSAFHIYRVISFAMPAPQTISENHNSSLLNSYTRMNNLPEYLGVSTYEDAFLELSYLDINHCLGDNNLYCDQQFTTYKTSYPSCAYAIFQDRHNDITKHCDIQLLLNHTPKPTAVYLENSQILLQSHNTSWTLKCQNKPETFIEPCDLCLINIGCGCELHSKWTYLSATLLHCAENETASTSHILNMQMAKSLFPHYNLSDITGSRTFSSPWKAELPDINILQKDFDATLTKDRSIVLDMDKIAKSHNELKFHYASPLDQLALTSGQEYDLFTAPYSYIAQIFSPSLIIAVLSSVVSFTIYLHLRRLRAQVHHLSVAIAATHLIPGVKAAPLNFLLQATTSESPSSPESDEHKLLQTISKSEYIHGIIMILTSLILFYLGKYILSYVKSRLFPIPSFATENTSQILLELANENESVTLLVKTIPHPPTRIRKCSRKSILDAEVKMENLRGYISIIWKDVKLMLKDRPMENLQLPGFIGIPIGYASKTKRIVQSGNYFHRLLIGQSSVYTEIPIHQGNNITENPYEYIRPAYSDNHSV